MALVKKEFQAEGMTCTSCEKIIMNQAKKIHGVKKIKADYITGQGIIEYDDKITDIDTILSKIEEKGYTCLIVERVENDSTRRNSLGIIFTIIGVLTAGYFLFPFFENISLPSISPSMSYGLLFVVGLLTGFHCVAMCGGFVLSYTAKDAKEGKSSYKSHLLYASGKTLSYTLIGAIFGLIGSIFAFTPTIRGIAGIIAGLFLIIFGLNMLNIFPILRRIRIKTPEFLNKFTSKHHEKNSKSPLIIGLLNGLMIACGPLQAIYIMAAGTGSAIEGAKLLFIFGLGTLPAMMLFGYFATFVSNKVTHNILKASGVIIIILGLLMLNNGLTLQGKGYDAKSIITKMTTNTETLNQKVTNSPESKNIAIQKSGYQEIYMDVTSKGWSPDKFILKKGVAVHWIINGKEITSCNNAIQVPKYNLKFPIKQGEQTIEFTPTELGVVSWSCWMGMIPGTFVVVDDITNAETVANANNIAAPVKTGGSCGIGCGCGGR